MPHRASEVGHIRRIIKSLVRLHAQFDSEGWEANKHLEPKGSGQPPLQEV
jgi:hypothetical protein